jgi:hypothetical protein
MLHRFLACKLERSAANLLIQSDTTRLHFCLSKDELGVEDVSANFHITDMLQSDQL